jgi:hypothetical protein
MLHTQLNYGRLKMEKNTQWIVVTFTALALLLGIVAGAVLIPTEKEVTVEKVVEETIEVPVEVEVEVEKDFDAYKQEALDLCLAEFLEDMDLDRYQDAEIKKVSDGWSITFGEYKKDKSIVTTIIDEITFRVFDSLEEEREDFEYKCEIIDKEDKELKVNLE